MAIEAAQSLAPAGASPALASALIPLPFHSLVRPLRSILPFSNRHHERKHFLSSLFACSLACLEAFFGLTAPQALPPRP
jgi:hypothetical protein